MHVKADNVGLLRIEFKDELLVLIFRKFLNMSHTDLKLDVCIFGGCDECKMDKLGISSVEFSHNNDKLFWSDLRLFECNGSIRSEQLSFLNIILRQLSTLEHIELKLIQWGNNTESNIFFLI